MRLSDAAMSAQTGRSPLPAHESEDGVLQALHDMAHDPSPEQPEHETFESPY